LLHGVGTKPHICGSSQHAIARLILDPKEQDMTATQSAERAAPSMPTPRFVLAQNWWALALRGVLGIVFGLIALFMPGTTILSLVLVFAAYALFDGILAITAAVRAVGRHERWGYLLLEGVVDIIAAVAAVSWPGITVLVFILLLAAWAIASGILMIGAAFRLHEQHGRWWLVLGGVVSVLYGALLVAAPFIGAVVLTWWIGAYALVFGAALLITAFRLRAAA
jgi:uncharacterized membrane protein HdeD (DUF308 family)